MYRVTFTVPLGEGQEPITGIALGATHCDVVAEAKVILTPHILARVGKLVRPFVKAKLRKATPLEFARLIVAEYNKRTGEKAPNPSTCEKFLTMWALPRGFAKIEIVNQK